LPGHPALTMLEQIETTGRSELSRQSAGHPVFVERKRCSQD
jgi:hypothetical protein